MSEESQMTGETPNPTPSAPQSTAEAPTVPDFPVDGVVDAHVHLMPDRLMRAIRDALTAEAGWTFDHPTDLASITDVLTDNGVDRFVALPYAHRSGVARDVNEWVLERATDADRVVPFATVHAADDDPAATVRDALDAGARGLKFQLPVQGFGPDDPRLDPVYELLVERNRPVLMHVGTAPMFRDDPNIGFEPFRRFRESFPDVRVCVPHMGTYQVDEFVSAARADANVYLDTTFAMSSVADQYGDFDTGAIPDAVF